MPFTRPFTLSKSAIFGLHASLPNFRQIHCLALQSALALLQPAPSQHGSPPSLCPPSEPLPSATGGGGVHVHACDARARVDQHRHHPRDSTSRSPSPAAGAHTQPHHAPDLHASGRHCPHGLAACPRLRAPANSSRSRHGAPAKQAEIGRCRRGTAGRRHGRPGPPPSRPSSPQHLCRSPSRLPWQGWPSADAAAAARRVAARASAAG